MASAAMAFIGCTGSGIPKTKPVRMLNSPEKMRVDDKEMESCWAREIIRGSRVPRSPRAPESSAQGWRRRVRRLWAWRRGMSLMSLASDISEVECGAEP
ncbi:hypothetical protein GE09DRAFT_1100253 [Coniochaeta sp. 2T2.1]|nr:hypothetical protein GE09DRAFT_1100253 [Coniochaeta sp. 2T2.1]